MNDKSLGSRPEPDVPKESSAASKFSDEELYQEAIDRFADLFYRHALMILEKERKNRKKIL